MTQYSHHHAAYDAQGNIIILADEKAMNAESKIAREAPTSSPVHLRKAEKLRHSSAVSAKRFFLQSYREAKQEFGETLNNIRVWVAEIMLFPKQGHQICRSIVRCVLLRRPKKLKARSRTTLFVIDIFRFGGTFAGIFAALFISMNFQSYWQIVTSQLAIGDDQATEQTLKRITSRVTDVLEATPISHSSESRGFLYAISDFLPDVGPPENRLIVPKLGKNVPIVIPAVDALLKEDWSKFGHDVQAALRHGVVHYPGTAEPGDPGNFFITGHSSYYPWDKGNYKDAFARLHELVLGDTYSVYFGGDLYTYRIIEKKEVRPTDVSVLDRPTNKRLATLMTCTPIGTTLRRLILVAEEVDPDTGIALSVGEKGRTKKQPGILLDTLPI